MGYIDTSDKIDHDQMQRQRVWALVDVIEHRTNCMAHEIDGVKDTLKRYQDGYLKSYQFINFLTKYIDTMDERV